MKTFNSNSENVNKLFAKTRTSIMLLDTMKVFFATNNSIYKITKAAQAKRLYEGLLTHLAHSIPTLRNPFVASKQLEYYGIKNSTDFATLLLERSSDFLEARFNLKCIHEISVPKLSKLEKIGRDFVSTYGKGRVMEIDENYEEDPMDNEVRTIVVRSKYGNGPVLSYSYTGKITKNSLNSIKAAYHYETKISYFEARPILLSSWLKLDDIRKNCTCQLVDGDSDLEEIGL